MKHEGESKARRSESHVYFKNCLCGNNARQKWKISKQHSKTLQKQHARHRKSFEIWQRLNKNERNFSTSTQSDEIVALLTLKNSSLVWWNTRNWEEQKDRESEQQRFEARSGRFITKAQFHFNELSNTVIVDQVHLGHDLLTHRALITAVELHKVFNVDKPHAAIAAGGAAGLTWRRLRRLPLLGRLREEPPPDRERAEAESGPQERILQRSRDSNFNWERRHSEKLCSFQNSLQKANGNMIGKENI